mmetsp:Transcript_16021/g.24860  ORF Transcript_16021/g.24860 Transcript_16021/m.24860 type:complete len:96 (-) Transcript_16021:473-760(-)
MEVKQKELGKALEKMSNEDDYQNKLRGLVEELRVWKDKVRKLQDQQDKEEKSMQSQQKMLLQIQEENDLYKKKIVQLKQEKGLPSSPPGSPKRAQ